MKKLGILIVILTVLTIAYAGEVKWTAKSELTGINDADILLVVDDVAGTPISKKITVLNFFDTIDTFAKLDTIVADKSLVNLADGAVWLGVHDFGGATSTELFNDAAPTTNATGEIALDITITDHQPLWQYYDGGENMTLIAIDTAQLPAQDNEIIKYDAGTNKFVLEADASGGSTAWDDIADPDNSGLTTITFDNAELSLLTGDNDAAASFFTIQNTDADHTGGNLYLLDLDYSADDGDVDADFIKCQDSGGVVYTVQQDGVVTGTSFTDGTATLTGGALTGLTTALTVAQGGTGATSLNDGYVLLGSNTAAITPLAVVTDGLIVIGDGAGDPTTLDVGSSTAITILGTVATGTWQATAIADAYIPDNITIDLATLASTITVADNESTDEENALLFSPGGDVDGGNYTPETDGDITYNPSTGELRVTANIVGEPKHLIFNIFNPLGVQTDDTQVSIWLETPAALTITNIKITLDAAGNEVAGDLMFADTFIDLANATVINVCDTTSGVIDDSAMADGTVPSGKAVYFQFDSAPNTAITQMSWDITWDYD